MHLYGFLTLVLGAGMVAQARDSLSLFSPNRRLELRIAAARDQSRASRPAFQVIYEGRELIHSELGIRLSETDPLEKAVLTSIARGAADKTSTLQFGKSRTIRDHYRELSITVATGAERLRTVRILFRAYDDGLAFRYCMPEQAGVDGVEVTEESSRFFLVGNPLVWPLYRENYTTSHEGLYSQARLSDLQTNQLIDLPLAAQFDQGVNIAITEANLRNYAGAYLKAQGEAAQKWLRCDLSPLPGQTRVKVRSNLPLLSPWRVILVGKGPGRLLESNLLLALNEPSVIGDDSWLKAGKTTWYWWNGPYQEPVDFKIDLNPETMKRYVEFCARNGIAFHSIMSTVDGYPWYFQTHHGYDPGSDTDITRPRGEFPMQQVIDLAKAKGVGIRLWVHWKPLSEHLEEAFTQYERWGVSGLMVDFLDRDDQEMVAFAERVLQSAARHHLHIHFHGVWKPTGLQRTYPNLFNHEGVLNLEYLKWGNECDPKHNVTVPFTRMVAGPMDYHLGGFRAARRSEFKPENFKPSVLGTRCHHLAMYVVYENPMPMVSDAPSAYEGQPGFDFIRQVPTTWDETRVLAGSIGEYIVVARRKGADWYVGAMTDWTPRILEVPLSFLKRGRHLAQIWSDVADSEDLNRLTFEQQTLDSHDLLKFRLRSGGGQVLRIHGRDR
jgi:alpha-glucosidase